MTPISPNSIIVKNPGFFESVIGDELVMMSEKDGAYFEMNETGRNIWQAFKKKTSIKDVCTGLTEKYNVDQGLCVDEVIIFFTELHKAGVVDIL